MEVDTPFDAENPFLTPQEEQPPPLPYDDESAAAAAAAAAAASAPSTSTAKGPSLADRIGRSRVYLLSESSASLHGRITDRKRKSQALDEEEDRTKTPPEGDVTADASMRDNAIVVRGTPISQLPTAKIFGWASHFHEPPPMGLEWIDDTTVILLYKTSVQARAAFEDLIEDPDGMPNEWGQFVAHRVPVELWPPQARVEKLLTKGGGLDGEVLIRWATVDDVKKRGAAKDSQFYKKYGTEAGKEGRQPVVPPPSRDHTSKRRREGHPPRTEEEKRAALDAELDQLGSGEPSAEPEERPRLSSRVGSRPSDGRHRGRRGNPHNERGHASKEDLDAELESFLKGRAES